MPYNYLAMERRIKSTFPKIENAIYTKQSDLNVNAWLTKEPVPFNKKKSGQVKALKPGDNWGDLFDCAWFNIKGSVPADEIGEHVLIVDLSGEGCVVDDSGNPIQGITTFSSMYDFTLGMPGKKVIYLEKIVQKDGSFDFWIDAGNNDLFGNLKNNGTLVEAHTAKINKAMQRLYYDFEVLNELRSRSEKKKTRFHTLTRALHLAAIKLVDYTYAEAVTAHEVLKPELERKNYDYPLKVNAIGHSHIDLAWLWPIRETIRKGARTFSTALMNLEKYPEYIFGASQPQLYQWMNDYYPELFQRVKKEIEKKKWEVQGAMWVESDTNVTGGEALIRQMLYGKKFYKEEFDIDVRNVWLPDVFGYSAALPQIMKKSDVDYFMTIKISWSEFNNFPHHTFIWQGIDGSKVLAHMPPEGTYNSSAAPRAILDAEEKFQDKGFCEECLLLYGIGDGGGGPGEEHLERLKREKNLQGLAPVNQGFASEFFERISKDIDKYKTWSGELYLEHHRGTYTSEGRNKRYNKLMEILLRDFEIVSCIKGIDYTMDSIENVWKEVLLYQFHDILPGSSIKRVYDESLERYKILENKVSELMGLNSYLYRTAFNTLSWDRSKWLKIDGKWNYFKINALAYSKPEKEEGNIKEFNVSIDADNMVLENEYLKASFNEKGQLKSLYEKNSNFEAIKDGYFGNLITVYKDEGDAWDFPHDYRIQELEKPVVKSIEIVQDGPEAKLVTHYKFRASTIKQEAVLVDGSRILEFRTILDWKDKNAMVRSAFPTSVETDEITCGIQFGFIKRPSHVNTSWDMAKLEVCSQDYIDKSRRESGVAILSDYKYGYSSTQDTIEINLLRSTGYPDIEGDIAVHEFTYAIYPHENDHIEGNVIKEAMELSHPLRLLPFEKSVMKTNSSFISSDAENIFVETIKKAEDENGIIVRLYEAYGQNTKTVLSFANEYESIKEVNLIERPLKDLIATDRKINLNFTPFEIKTILIT